VKLKDVHVGMYGAVMGLAGLGLTARAVASVWPGVLKAPAYFTEPWVLLGALALVVLIPLYLLKGLSSLKADFTSPMLMGFCGALPLGMALVAGGLAPYLDAVRSENPKGRLRFYPGSPLIALKLRRHDDRIALAELNGTDCAGLEAAVARARHVAVHRMDGYQALQAFLPPPERRGLVLVDSSFDRSGEFQRIVRALKDAYGRWPTGIFAVWYPLMEPAALRGFAREILKSGIRKVLRLEFSIHPAGWKLTLRGCGMLVVNPPWRFEAEARALLDWLWRALAVEGAGGVKVDWLAPER